MRSYFFTEREKVLLQSIINDSYESTPNNDMLLSALKGRIREYANGLFGDVDIMKKIIEIYKINYSN